MNYIHTRWWFIIGVLKYRLSLSDVQEKVQKKTFINWINSYLAKRQPPLKIQDLFEDLKDGSKLVFLLEVLSGEKLPVEKGRILRRPHFISNCNTSLEFLRSKKVNCHQVTHFNKIQTSSWIFSLSSRLLVIGKRQWWHFGSKLDTCWLFYCLLLSWFYL